jgi:DNA-binding NarL/FixJ family response regulator
MELPRRGAVRLNTQQGSLMIGSEDRNLLGARVLVVEDEYLLARDIVAALQAAGAHVIGPAGTTEAAARLIDAGPLDGAVLDMNLRGDRSAEIAERLNWHGIGYVVVSGYDPSSLPEAVRAKPYLSKPTTATAVAAAVNQVIGNAPRSR